METGSDNEESNHYSFPAAPGPMAPTLSILSGVAAQIRTSTMPSNKRKSSDSTTNGPTKRRTKQNDFSPFNSPVQQLNHSPAIAPHGESTTVLSQSGPEVLSPDAGDKQLIEIQNENHEPFGVAFTELEPELTANEIKFALLNLSTEIFDTSEWIIQFLGIRKNGDIHSTLVPDPQPGLECLYTKCWGSNWMRLYQEMGPQQGLTISNVLRALIASYVYFCVFEDGSLKACIACSSLSFDTGIDSERLFFALSSSDEADRAAVREDISAIRFSQIVQPHLERLAGLARILLKFDGEDDSWREGLTEKMVKILRAAGTLKHSIVQAKYKHEFLWPAHDTTVDFKTMRLSQEMARQRPLAVAFTIHPGVQVDFGSGAFYQVRPADVIAQPRESKSIGQDRDSEMQG